MTRVAMLTPLPPARSGVADYSACLLRALAERVEVTAYAPGPARPVPGVRVRRPTRRALLGLRRHDAVVAQVGNSDLHAWVLDALRGRRATVVLHDVVLHHMVAGMTLGRGDPEGYVAAMGAERGTAGRLLGHAVAERLIPRLWESVPHLYPLTAAALRDAEGVIVHSRFAERHVRSARPDLPVRVIPLATPPPPGAPPERLPGDPFPVVGCFGFVIREKRLPVVMRAMALLRRRAPRARLLVAGQAPPDLDPRRMAAEAGLPDDAVEVVGYADRERYERLVRAADIGVGLRHPTMGESSAAVAHLLSVGTATVVSPGGWYDELPDAAVARVAPGPGEAEALAGTLERLAGDDAARAAMGEAGQRYARERLDPGACADAYLRAVLAPRGRGPMREELLESLGAGLDEVAPGPARRATGVGRSVARAARSLGIA